MVRRGWIHLAIAVLVAPLLMAQANTPAGQIAQEELDQLTQAQTTLRAAEQAGAPKYARTLYDEAQYRIQFAQQNWSASKRANQDEARERAVEGLWAARAALAKARWLGTNAAVRSLQSDIVHFGGHADIVLTEEGADLELNRGSDSRARIAYAQGIVDAARAAGGEQIAAVDLHTAQEDLESARKITRASSSSDSADYLAYIAEMMARRAYYIARTNEAARNLAPLQLQRTQLAQSESEREAAAERAQREQAERQREALQAQLAAEQANREAQAAELEHLRAQLDESRRAMRQRVEEDRAALAAAEQQVDAAFSRYEAAISTGSAGDVEAARRDLEDRQIALRAIQQREVDDERSMSAEIDRLRNELQAAQQAGSMPADIVAQRQAEILQRQQEMEAFRHDRSEEVDRRAALEEQRATAIAAAQRRRADAEAQAQQMQQQLVAAQQAAQQAQQAAQSAQAQAEATQQAATAAQQQAQQTQADLERSRQETQAQLEATRQELARRDAESKAQLEATQQELARRDAEAQQLRMEQELARIAATREEERGLVVTLPSALFDTGKSTLKPGAKNTLSRIAQQLAKDPKTRIVVEGHTDNVGSSATNLALSERRASAVRDFLVSSGIPDASITAAGKGETEPVATNKTAAGRQQNRRVELIVTKQ